MITGDQTAIARETCRELDMGSLIYNADILSNHNRTALEEKELTECVERGNGFAEVFPEHKYLQFFRNASYTPVSKFRNRSYDGLKK